MPDNITITWDDAALVGYLDGLDAKLDNAGPMYHEIGVAMVESSMARFSSQAGPDGTPWAPNAASTVENWLRAMGRKSSKDGTFAGYKKGWEHGGAKRVAAAAAKKPLQGIPGPGGSLASQFHYALTGSGVEWGNSMIYSRVQQEGAAAHSLGPVSPWGDIPARPFLGLSSADVAAIQEIVGHWLLQPV